MSEQTALDAQSADADVRADGLVLMPWPQAALYAALAKAQGEFPPIPRDKTVTVRTKDGRSYTFAYAPLETIFATIRLELSGNGLAVTQTFRGDDLITSLLHSGGGMIESVMRCQRQTGTWQEFGSAITYARRYALVALLGLATEEDDDGNHASGNTAMQQKPARGRTTATEKAAEGSGGTADTPNPQNASQGVGLITEKQMKLVGAVLRKLGDGGVLDEDGYRAKLNEMNVDSTRDLTGPQASILIDWLKELEAAMDVEL